MVIKTATEQRTTGQQNGGIATEAGMAREETTMVTYSKLRDGSWGVRGPEDAIRAGQSVTVTKRSGETKRETVARVLWTSDGVALASIAATARPSGLRFAGRRSYGERSCHTDGNCSSMCSPQTCPCGDGGWFRCC